MEDLVSQGRLTLHGCDKEGGIKIHPNEGQWKGTVVHNCTFEGFDNKGCTSNAMILVDTAQVGQGNFVSSPRLFNNTVEQGSTAINACNARNVGIRYVAVEDIDGSLSKSGSRGFYIQDDEAVTKFLDTSTCHEEEGCLRFCPDVCLHLGLVLISNDRTTRGFHMHITDVGGDTTSIPRGYQNTEDSIIADRTHATPFVLPAPSSGTYQITFTDRFGNAAWPSYARTPLLERRPQGCENYLKLQHFEFVMPPSNERCDDLFYLDDFENDIYGWQNSFAGQRKYEEDGSYIIATTGRKWNARSNVQFLRRIDTSCIIANPGRTYSLSGKIRITNIDDEQVETDGSDSDSPGVYIDLQVWTYHFFVPTFADDWSEFREDIVLPTDMEGLWRAELKFSNAPYHEYHVKDFKMELQTEPSQAPTSSPAPSIVPDPNALTDVTVVIKNEMTSKYLAVVDQFRRFPLGGSTSEFPFTLQLHTCPTAGNYADHGLSSPCFLIFTDIGEGFRLNAVREKTWRQGLLLIDSHADIDEDEIWYLEQVECGQSVCALLRNAENGRTLFNNKNFHDKVPATPAGDQDWFFLDVCKWHFEISGTGTDLDLSRWASPAFTPREPDELTLQ